jgi:hypothetical protein
MSGCSAIHGLLYAGGIAMASGCGGGLPILCPARSLDPGEIRVSSGFSGNVPAGSFSSALADSRGTEGLESPGMEESVRARAAVVQAAIGAGISPVLAAHVGLGSQTEGGASFLGRAVRADVRRSFELAPHWALSAGAAGSIVTGGSDDVDASVDLRSLRGGGADVPLVVGYESDGGIYQAWFGARGGWEQVHADNIGSAPGVAGSDGPSLPLTATRLWAGGLFGFAVGFRHLHVAMELDVAYANVSGDVGSAHMRVSAPTLGPSSALWWTF